MLTRRLTRYITALCLVLAAVVATNANAQGITTGGVSGFVTDASGTPLENVQISITNRSTGFSVRTISRDGGRYSLPALETGGPYTLEARRIGFAPTTTGNIFIQLSQQNRVDIKLNAQATQLSALEVRATTGEIIAPSSTGTKTTVSQQALERSPTTTRNLVDFTRAAPQVSSAGPGFSGGGMSNRMNNVQIDGATERDVFGLGSTGQPGGQISAKAISIDAIKEYQILLAPYDVRQGNFGGLLLNAVTKSGTNTFHGSAFNYYRNQDYGRDIPVLRATDFSRKQFGFSLGGPIIKDKLQFFTANEWTRESTPVSGPYLGQPTSAATAFAFSEADITRFTNAYKAKVGGADPGTAGIVNSPTPMNNLFGRLDFQINPSNRLVARMNYTDATNNARRQNSRSATTAVMSSNFHAINSNKKAPVVQLFSNFGNGWSNEAFAGLTIVRDRRTGQGGSSPQITVSSGSNRIIAGTDQFSQGNELDADTYEFTDNLTIPRGNHSFVVGTRNEFVKIRNLFSQSSQGVWTFADIAAFEAGTANGFRRAIILGDDPNVYFDALQSAFYAQDTWTATPKLTLTLGLRGDNSRFLTDNSYAPAIDSAYPGHTTPKGAFQFSPRLGFNLDVTGDQINQLRGGIGLFVGTPPYVWLENAYAQNGRIITFLQCGSGFGNAANPAPVFNVDPTKYNTCANGQGAKPIGDVSFLDKGLKFPQPMRANVAFDRVLPGNLVATVEGLYSKTLNQLFFVNRNLIAPRATDKFGRAMYGVIATGGTATTDRPTLVVANGGTSRFSTAIDVENQNKDYAYNLTGQLRKRYSSGWEALIAYNYGHAYDVQSFTSSTHISNWSFGRTVGGIAQTTPEIAPSLFDQPHKLTAFVTKTLGWGRFIKNSWADDLAADFTVSYQGVSGSAHDYVYAGSSGRGDLNADGIVGNDLLYVPTDVNDVSQIRFQNLTVGTEVLTAASQAAAFEELISKSPCLNEARGTIMKRDSCRLPFSNNFDVTIAQNIPLISAGQRVTLQLDIFNFGNLLNKKWGQQQVSPYSSFNNVPLLTHTASSTNDPATAVQTFTLNYRTLDPDKTGTVTPYRVGNFVGNYWRMQLAARVSF
ncbi:MAG TPA: carboxypeptidase regulatory-like domain-containing protein [Gemmatimonadaceae bacterium]|nr:carboxypeptidase regulatory-like domain-containing protein [Gemmatimonadaceae bacterium]